MRIGFVITRASSLDVTWTTLALVGAALDRGHSVRLIERTDFDVDPSGNLVARSFAFEPPALDIDTLVKKLRRRTATRRYVDVSTLDLILLRSAPLTTPLLTFAQLAQERGVPVVNDPSGLVKVTSKAWLAGLSDVPTPPTLVTRSAGAGAMFYKSQAHGVVVKPARGSGGRWVSFVPSGQTRRFERAFENARRGGNHAVIQGYLQAAEIGEKRLLWLDGRILGGYLRRRAPGEFRHNLKQGATAEAAEVSDHERALLAPLTPHLVRAGVRFAGLDLIGDHLVEVNALNPGGTFHTDRLTGSTHANTVITHLEQPRPQPGSPEDEAWAHPAP
ncbi:MAG: hypothetical protein AB8H79_13805 [Myxococcota bacterium]